jgi:hypothetical protein
MFVTRACCPRAADSSAMREMIPGQTVQLPGGRHRHSPRLRRKTALVTGG